MRRQPVFRQQLLERLHESVVEELPWRHVDGDTRVAPSTLVPARRGFNGGAQHPVADLDDQSGFFGHGQEFAW
jgi:hypothetical protein